MQQQPEATPERGPIPLEKALETQRQPIWGTPLGNSGTESVAEAGFEQVIRRDPLTGLLNRASVISDLRVLLMSEDGGEAEIGVLFLTLDQLAAINEDLGTIAGDEVLHVVAESLRLTTRRSAIVARLSGDEFVVVDDFSNAAETSSAADRLRTALSAPMVVNGTIIEIDVSIGTALARTNDTPEQLLSRAAMASRGAEGQDHDRYEVLSRIQHDPGWGKFRILRDLRNAIEHDGLCLHYQPQIDLVGGQMRGLEALVRWDHPDRGLLAPAEFMDLAEKSGLILSLGAWVINEAVAQQAQWHRSAPGRSPITMSVNISATQLNDPGLVETVLGALDRFNVAPSLLTLDITETALMEDQVAAMQTLKVLHTLGVRLAIDDFGTGHSGLTLLKRFPFDDLKIDRAFIAGLPSEKKDYAIVAACVELAHAMGMVAVAEGVETAGQQRILMELGCDLAQGYHYTKPMTSADLIPWFTTRPETVNTIQLPPANEVHEPRLLNPPPDAP